MRLDTKEDGENFWLRHFDDLVVKLDGVEVKGCVCADDIAGFVDAFVFDEAGSPIVDGDEFRVCRKHGKVEFVGERRSKAII